MERRRIMPMGPPVGTKAAHARGAAPRHAVPRMSPRTRVTGRSAGAMEDVGRCRTASRRDRKGLHAPRIRNGGFPPIRRMARGPQKAGQSSRRETPERCEFRRLNLPRARLRFGGRPPLRHVGPRNTPSNPTGQTGEVGGTVSGRCRRAWSPAPNDANMGRPGWRLHCARRGVSSCGTAAGIR